MLPALCLIYVLVPFSVKAKDTKSGSEAVSGLMGVKSWQPNHGSQIMDAIMEANKSWKAKSHGSQTRVRAQKKRFHY